MSTYLLTYLTTDGVSSYYNLVSDVICVRHCHGSLNGFPVLSDHIVNKVIKQLPRLSVYLISSNGALLSEPESEPFKP